ncbi:MAG: citrate/2-methylcitrate synthase [Lachnospiraceae bacterium]|nr:citrate/2-methylcitrate synthase [Lachnospiraceae bacterium]
MGFRKETLEYAASKNELCIKSDTISDNLFKEYGVNRGLRDVNGKGVPTGLTNISKIISFKEHDDGSRTPCDGEIWYRGYNVRDLVKKFSQDGFGFERTAYLLLLGELPDEEEMSEFVKILAKNRSLPRNFTRDVIMKAATRDIMNSMTRSILTLASYDKDAASTDINNTLRQCIMLIATFPMLAVYAYHAYMHYEKNASMYIHRPDPSRSTAENFLMMLRPDKQYTELEARVLDVALMLHMEHGGGNNSTFTTRVVTSSGTDTYAAIAAAMSSLKGPRHGGANIKVMEMMANIRENIRDWNDKDEIYSYLSRMMDGEVFDRKGLIYGMGHAIYSISDPRERIFKKFVLGLAESKGKNKELALYENIEELAPKVIAEKRHIFKGVSPNVDFYSGFVYSMMNIPLELYTPLFAVARISGWCAHRLEEIVGAGKIIRPAYISVMEEKDLP